MSGNNTKKKLSAFEQELVKASQIVKSYMLPSEASICFLLFKNPELLYNNELKLEDFQSNCWKVFYVISRDLVLKEKKVSLDAITVDLYLEKHPKLKEKYEEYGGFETVSEGMSYAKEENLEGYISDIHKWNVVLKLLSLKFPVIDRLSEFTDMSADMIYAEYESLLSHVFLNIQGDVKTYNLSHDIHGTIAKLNDGLAVGLPYHNLPMLNNETGGMCLGGITLLGGLSNEGKSTIMRNAIIPSIIENGERVVIMVNEDSLVRAQREMLIWIINNIFKEDMQKHVLRNGNFTKEATDLLTRAGDWLIKKCEDHTITIVPFKTFSTSSAIKIINKYSRAFNIKNFCLDTFKVDDGEMSELLWMKLEQNMTKINDVVKAESKNLHIFITFQLNKSSAVQRYYTQYNIGGGSKGILNPAATCVMVRSMLLDEFGGEKNEIKVWRIPEGSKTPVPVELDKNKKFQIFFIIKSRDGAKDVQIVVEHDMSRNILKEVGFCMLSPTAF